MREVIKKQMQFGDVSIRDINFDLRSRDEIVQLLLGLQHIYINQDIREEIFGMLRNFIPSGIDVNNGRPGMDLWNILVLGSARLNFNWDYDHLLDMANNHKKIREMLGHGPDDEDYLYSLQTIKDNVHLMSEEHLIQINNAVVKAGHKLLNRNPDEILRCRCDSFVVKTDVEFPTDIELLFVATRKIIKLTGSLCFQSGSKLWSDSEYDIRQIKKLFRKVQIIKHSTSKDDDKKNKQEEKIMDAYHDYIELADLYLNKSKIIVYILVNNFGVKISQLTEIEDFIDHSERQIDQIQRRVFCGEQIPHDEKVFSLFEEHTEWISKGKAGVPVELGLRVCILEDQDGFILHHQVMEKTTDDKIAVPFIKKAQKTFPNLKICSFDKGFHSPSNQIELRKILDVAILPRKGRLSAKDKELESSSDFVKGRRQHSAVESGINALEVHGLDKCLDHGLDGFKRYVALAVLARNIQKLGAIKRKIEIDKKKTDLKEAA